MKKYNKILCFLLVLIMAAAFTACGGNSDGGSDSESSDTEVKTMGEIFALEVDDQTLSVAPDKVVYIYTIDGKPTRVEAAITEEMYSEIDAIPFDDEDRDAKIHKILEGVEVTRTDDMSEYVPTDEEVEALVGKTGQELIDAGFDMEACIVDGNVTTVNAARDYAEYMLEFDGTVDDESDEWAAELAELKVTSASYTGLAYTAVTDFE